MEASLLQFFWNSLRIDGFFYFVLFCFCLFRATPIAHGSSQARGRIRAVAAGLCQSHSHARSKLHLDLHHSSPQRQILNPLSEARDQICNLVVPSQIYFHCATMGTPQSSSYRIFSPLLSSCLVILPWYSLDPS